MHSVGLPESLHQARPHELGATSITDFSFTQSRQGIAHTPYVHSCPALLASLSLDHCCSSPSVGKHTNLPMIWKSDALPSGMAVAAKRTVLYGQYHNITPPPPLHTLPRHADSHPTPTPPRYPPTSPSTIQLTSTLYNTQSHLTTTTTIRPLDARHPHNLHTRPHPTLLRTLHRPSNTWSYQR